MNSFIARLCLENNVDQSQQLPIITKNYFSQPSDCMHVLRNCISVDFTENHSPKFYDNSKHVWTYMKENGDVYRVKEFLWNTLWTVKNILGLNMPRIWTNYLWGIILLFAKWLHTWRCQIVTTVLIVL